MKSLFSYLITILAVIYWIFRVIVSLMYSMGENFICEPINPNIEILILFLTIPSIIFIIRRNAIVATLYFGMYAAYFGTLLYDNVMNMSGNLMRSIEFLVNTLGVVIPLLVFFDVIIQKRIIKYADKNTDWYYTNEKYDREFDERVDRNHYKIK